MNHEANLAVLSALIAKLIEQEKFKEADALFHQLVQLALNRSHLNVDNQSDEAA